MSWLGNGLSQITGQISTFTKEVLTEGTEEVDDHVTELRLARKRLSELEAFCLAQKSEIERVKQTNEELQDKVESTDLQINAISTEYRAIVQAKEVEIVRLKQQTQSSVEEFSDHAYQDQHDHHHGYVAGAGGVYDDDVDHDDLGHALSSQREINRLAAANKTLTAQLTHWRNLAQSQRSEAPAEDAHSIAALRTRVKELEEQVEDEVDQHQKQLATLQDVHAQKLHTLHRMLQQEQQQPAQQTNTDELAQSEQKVRALQEKCSGLEQKCSGLEQKCSGLEEKCFGLEASCSELESGRHRLSVDLELTHAADREKARQMSQLTAQLTTVTEHRDQLLQEQASLKNTEVELRGEIQQLLEERISSAQARVSSSGRRLPATPESTRQSPVEEQVEGLQSQVLTLERCVAELEMSQADWQMEKEALEEVLLRMKREAAVRQSSDEVELLHQQIHSLQDKVKSQHEELLNMTGSQADLSRELDERTQSMNKLEEELSLEKGARESMEKEHGTEVGELLSKLKQYEEDIEQLNAVLTEKSTLLSESNSRFSELEKQGNINSSSPQRETQSSDDHRALMDSKTSQIEALTSELKTLQELVARLQKEAVINEDLIREERGLREEQEEAVRRLEEEFGASREALEGSLVELDEQHQAAINVVITDRDNLVTDNQQLKGRLREEAESATRLREEGDRLKEEAARLRKEADSAARLREEAARLREEAESAARLREEVAKLREEAESAGRLREEADSLREVILSVTKHREECEERVRQLELEVKEVTQSRTVVEEEKSALERVVEKMVSAEEQRRNDNDTHASDQLDAPHSDSDRSQAVREEGRCELCHELRLEAEQLRTLVKTQQDDLEAQKLRYEEDLKTKIHQVSSLEGQNMRLQQELQHVNSELQNVQQQVTMSQNEMNSNDIHQESRLSEVQVMLDEAKDRNAVLESEVSRLMGRSSDSCDKCHEAQMLITELNENVVVLEKDIADKDKVLEENDKEITRLKKLSEGTSENVTESQGDGEVILVRKQLERAMTLIPQTQHKYLDPEVNIPDNLPSEDTDSSELHTQQVTLEEKEAVICELQKRCSSLTGLLEEHSRSTHGSNVLVELHSLEGEVRRLRTEREQMMSVMEEKTREVSSLKSEVHRLMNRLSQAAVAKQEPAAVNPAVNPNQDMSKEAIKKLSQLIKDKDLEVESLQQKNATLLQVLQEAGGRDGTTRHLASVIQERDNLIKQVQVFQKDREGLIDTLTTKHKESLAYHTEVQRLQAVLAETSDKSVGVERDYHSLQQQHQHKQKAYLKVQNQLANFKQKYVDLESRYQELVSQREGVGERRESDEAGAAGASCQEVHDLRALLLSHEEAFSQKDQIHEEQRRVIEEKDKLLGVKEAELEEKEAQLGELSRRVRSSEELVNSSQAQITALRKQHEHSTFTLEGLQGQLEDAVQEKRRLAERADNLAQEMTSHTDALNQMTIRYNDKEFEVSALREKAATLTGMLQRHGGEEGERREEAQRLLGEVEAASHQAQSFKQERDQVTLALQQTQMDNNDLKMQLARAGERAVKLERECERLKSHLLQVEEGYTGEALRAEEREKELRTRLATAEERLLRSSAAVKNASVESSRAVESLQHQVAALTEEKDQVLLRLAASQETAHQYNTSLTNLQMVLEHFQLDKESQQSSEHELHQRELAAERRETQQLRQELQLMQSQLEETTDALEAAQRLSEQLDRKEEMIAALRHEVQLREKELQGVEDEMSHLTSTTEGKVDKLVIKNVLLAYLTSASSKRSEVLHVIGKLLDFSPQELAQVGGVKSGGWLGGLLGSVKSSPTPPTTPSHALNKSFSELFVTFLEKESTPTRAVRLPAEQMAREELEKHSHQPPPAFNPFSTPLPRDTTPSHTAPHLLINPGATPSAGGVPLFAAPSPGVGSGAILRDVLQQ